MPIPRFPNRHFPGFYQFRMEKEELALEMKNFYSFPYSLMHIRPSKYTETTFYMVLCCLYCYLATYFLLSSTVFIVDFEHLNDG